MVVEKPEVEAPVFAERPAGEVSVEVSRSSVLPQTGVADNSLIFHFGSITTLAGLSMLVLKKKR